MASAIKSLLPFCLVSITNIWLAVPPCSAFHLPLQRHSILTQSPSSSFHHRQLYRRLAASSNTDDSESIDDRAKGDEIPSGAQDLRLFLTQRCIQSFMYLLSSTHDLHTVSWLDNFTQPITINNYWDEDDDLKPGAEDTFRENDKRIGSKMLRYHGLSALNTTMFPKWDSFFTTLLEQPDAVLMISTPKDVGRRAYSEFDIDIEPARLCTRILSVREQIAREMAGDLKAIANMGQLIFNSYWQNAKDRKDTTKESTETNSGGDETSSPYAFDYPSTMYINFDPLDDSALAPSPLRKGNFDLLYNLITQSAVEELLQSEDGVVVGEDEVQNRASQLFLSKYYEEHLLTHFVGSQWYGKGDEFIEHLMLGSPIMMSRSDDDIDDDDQEIDESSISSTPPLVVEPMRIAEQILKKRDKLALEWMEVMDAVPSDHTEIRKLQLTRLTGVVDAEAEPVKIVFDDVFQ